MEKLMLEHKKPLAVVVNVKDMSIRINQIQYQIQYQIVNGGPLMIDEESE